MRLSWRSRLWQAASAPVWILGRGLTRAGIALGHLHFRMQERALDLPPGALRRTLQDKARPPPTPEELREAVTEIKRQFRCRSEGDRC